MPEETAPADFHIYIHERDVTVILDPEDPQREEIMKAMAEVFNRHERFREANECLGIGING
jgi:acyl-CoA hydrolase